MTVDPSDDSVATTEMTIVAQISDKILALQTALSKQLPSYEGLLHVIHRTLAQQPETVHFLTDEEIGIICAGLSKKTGVVLSAKDKKITAKSLKGITADDL
ncbi:unnamed protein product [Sphagnum jensenii]